MMRGFPDQIAPWGRGTVPEGVRFRGSLLRRLPAFLLLVAAALLLPASMSRAEKGNSEGTPPSDLTTLTIEELMRIEVETVSGASKYDQPVTEAPASVSIVTSDEIRKFGYRTLADILQSIRGFSVIGDRNYRYAGIRGFDFPGDYGSRMLLLVDGVRLNDPIYQTSAIGNEFILDVDLIDRVEIIRGPSYSLYGSNAMLAVINVVTKNGRDLDGVEASASAGSFDTYKGRLSYGGRPSYGPEILLSGSLFTSKGEDLFYPEFNSPSTNFGWARGCDGEGSGNAFLKILYRDFTLEGAYVRRRKNIPTAPWGTLFNNSGTETWDVGAFLDLKYHRPIGNDLDLATSISINRYANDGRYIYIEDEPGKQPVAIANIDYARASWLAGELRITRDALWGHKLMGGVEFQDVLSMVQKNHDREVYLDDRRSAWNIAAYIQDEYRILDDLILNAGLRYDYFDVFGGALNPRVALIYTPFSGTSLKFLVGTGFRAPNGFELHYGDGSTMKPNPKLREERSTSYELILEQYFGRHFRGTVLGYHTRVKDLITQVLDPLDGMLTYANICEADMKGVELEMEGKWDNGVTGRISYGYQDGKNPTTGEWLTNSARHLVKLSLLAPIYRDRVFLGVEQQYTGAKQTLFGTSISDYFITNLTLFSSNLPENLEISGSVHNLFDTVYRAPGGGEHIQSGIEQEGRSFSVKLTYRFR